MNPSFATWGKPNLEQRPKAPRVNGEFDQRLDPSLGAKDDSSAKLSRSSDANEVSAVLEWFCLQAAQENGSFKPLVNLRVPVKLKAPKRDRPDAEEAVRF